MVKAKKGGTYYEAKSFVARFFWGDRIKQRKIATSGLLPSSQWQKKRRVLKTKNYTINVKLDKIVAPVKKGDKIGIAKILDNEGNIITSVGITVKENVLKANLWDYFKRNLNMIMSGKNVI